MGHSESSHEREVHSYTGLPQKKKMVINYLTLQLKELERKQQEEQERRGKTKA
jgi:hypothetical protein